MHEPALLKLPPAPVSFHVTAPVGVVAIPVEMSVIRAVNVIMFPIMTSEGFGDTSVVVARRLTVSVDVPELVIWLESPR